MNSINRMVAHLLLAGFLATPVFLAGNSTDCQASDKAVKFKLHHHDPLTATVARDIDRWVKKVEQNAAGKVKITIYPSATLGSPKDAYDMVENGVCDIAWGFTGFMAGVFPVSEGLSLPMLGLKNCEHGTTVLMDMYENTDLLKPEYEKIHLIFIHALSAYPIGTKKTQITSFDDLKGLKLRVPGGPPTSYMVHAGASPMNIVTPELYTSLERRVIDGVAFDWTGLVSFKLYEQLDHVLDCGLATGVSWFAMNKEKWASLPEDVKAAFDKESGFNGAREFAQFWDNDTRKFMESSFKGKINTLSDAEQARWQANADQEAQNWIKDMTAKGYDGQVIYDKYKELVTKYAK